MKCQPQFVAGDTAPSREGDASSSAKKCPGKYTHRGVAGGIGHSLPQEAPQAFAKPSSMSIVINCNIANGWFHDCKRSLTF
jgi:hypothetical protein